MIKRLKLTSRSGKGLQPSLLRDHEIEQGFGYQVSSALWKLKSLDLQVTPLEVDRIRDQHNPWALGLLPHLLSRTTGLKRLFLRRFEPEEDLDRQLLCQVIEKAVSPVYYRYDQLFPINTRWNGLRMLYISGLAISDLDLFNLVFWQAPNLQFLWLRNIHLSQGSWYGVMEVFKARRQWEMLSFQGLFRHCEGQCWSLLLPTWENEQEEWDVLSEYNHYVQFGGQCPILHSGALNHDSPVSKTEHLEWSHRYQKDLEERIRAGDP